MSGGYFDYLNAKSAQELCDSKEHLHEMAEVLREIGAFKAYRDTARVLAIVELLEQAADDNPLMEVWHAIEWWKSADWSMVQAAVVAGNYSAKREAWHIQADEQELP